jgi:hypothetical protein
MRLALLQDIAGPVEWFGISQVADMNELMSRGRGDAAQGYCKQTCSSGL